jgi:septum formation protein
MTLSLPLILASGSSARRQILAGAGVCFTVQPADVDEEAIKQELLAQGLDPKAMALALAEAKALDRSKESQTIVIGADQTLDLEGELFNKAATLDALRTCLLRLRGKTHQLHSATVIAKNGQILWREVVSARLTMRAFSDDFLNGYLQRQVPQILPSVGGYQLESEGVQLFDQIEGDYFTILGLPLSGLLAQLRLLGILDQ